MGIAARLYQDGRWAERHRVELEATLRDSDRQPDDVSVEDLSHGGFRVVSDLVLQVGEDVALGIAGIGVRQAHVVWRGDGAYGCEFVRPLSDGELRTALAAPTAAPIAFPGVRMPAPTLQMPETEAATAPEPLAKFPMPIRIAIIAGGAILSWGVVIALGWGVVKAVRALVG